MKRTLYVSIIALFLTMSFTSCREEKSAGEKIEDGVEEVGEGIEDAVD